MEELSSIGFSLREQDVAAAFDAVASTYDADFGANPIALRLRARIYGLIQELIPRGGNILDINCGTGTDAWFLSSLGYRVHGIDVSHGMIEIARRKAAGSSGISFRVCSFEQLYDAIGQKFDLVLSNFGGMNCTADLGKVATQVAAATMPGGYFVAVVMPPFSLWETLSGLLRNRSDVAFRRLNGTASAVGFRPFRFEVTYYSPRSFSSSFLSKFALERIIGLNIASPPPSAHFFARKHPVLTSILERIDRVIGSIPLVRSLGDHFIVILRRSTS